MSNEDFKIGDHVKLSENSSWASTSDHLYDGKAWTYGNPVGIVGVIITNEQYSKITGEGVDDEYVYVWWKNNMINCYLIGEDDLVKTKE